MVGSSERSTTYRDTSRVIAPFAPLVQQSSVRCWARRRRKVSLLLSERTVDAAAQALHGKECEILGWQIDWPLMNEHDREFYRILARSCLEAARNEAAFA